MPCAGVAREKEKKYKQEVDLVEANSLITSLENEPQESKAHKESLQCGILKQEATHKNNMEVLTREAKLVA